jgi:hypothetical protein
MVTLQLGKIACALLDLHAPKQQQQQGEMRRTLAPLLKAFN